MIDPSLENTLAGQIAVPRRRGTRTSRCSPSSVWARKTRFGPSPISQERANRLAAALIAGGLERGDRFGLMMRNHPEFVEAMIAASITATVFVPIDPRTRGEKLAFTLRDSGARAIVLADYNLPQLQEVRDQIPELGLVLALGSGEDGAPPMEDYSGVGSLDEILGTPSADGRRAPARPDRQVPDHLHLRYDRRSQGRRHRQRPLRRRLPGRRSSASPEEDCLYTGLSLTHGNAQAVTFSSAIGAEIPCRDQSALHQVAAVGHLPQARLYHLLAAGRDGDGHLQRTAEGAEDADNPVRFVTSAGMPRAVWEPFEERFDLKILEWYGAVEGGLAFKPIGVGPVGSFGKAPPGSRDEGSSTRTTSSARPSVPGEICSRPETGEAPSVEYLDKPDASAEKTRGGWLRSGDVGHTDDDGWLFFDYRKGGGLRHNGDFVNAGFVEKVIAEHDGVSDVFVYGVPASSGAPGEKDVVAAVVPRGTGLDPASVFALCTEGLEGNFVPSYLQVVRDEIRALFDSFLRHAAQESRPDDLIAAAAIVLTRRERAELEALAELAGVPVWQAIITSGYYDLFSSSLGCTALAIDAPEGPWHARNLDWFDDSGLLRSAGVICRFLRDGATRFWTIGWPGYLAALSGVAPGRFAVTLNAVASAELRSLARPVSYLIREVLDEATDFDSARERLADTPILSDCILMLTGPRPGEIAVIERTPSRHALRGAIDGVAVATNHYVALDTEPPMSASGDGPLASTSGERFERASELARAAERVDGELLLSLLGQSGVSLDITVQQMVLRASDGTVIAGAP